MHKGIIHDRPEPGDTLMILSGPFAGELYLVQYAKVWQFRLDAIYAGGYLYVDWKGGKITGDTFLWDVVIVKKHEKTETGNR